MEPRERRPVVQLGALGGDLKAEDVFGVVPRIDVTQRPEAAYEQTRAHEEHKGRGGLHQHQSVAAPVTARFPPLTALPQSTHESRSREFDCRNEPERTRGQERDPGGEDQRGGIKARKVEIGDTLGSGTDEQRETGPCEKGGACTTHCRQQQGLRHLGADQAGGSRAQGLPHGEIAPPALRPDGEQVRDVRTRDEEDDRDGAQQEPERLREVADQLLLERPHDRTMLLDDARVSGRAAETLGKATSEDGELLGQGRMIRPRPHPPDEAQPEAARREVLPVRDQIVDPDGRPVIQESELGVHHPDHCAPAARDFHRAIDHRRVAAEPAHPELVANHDHLTLGILLRGQAPEQRRHPDGREERGAHSLHEEPIGPLLRAHGGLARIEETEVFEQVRILVVLDEELGTDAELRRHIGAGGGRPDRDEAIGIGERERIDQYGVHHAEDRSVGSDGEGKRHHGHDSETRRASKSASRVHEVSCPGLEPTAHLRPPAVAVAVSVQTGVRPS